MSSVSLDLSDRQSRSAVATIAIGSFLARRLTPERIVERLREIRHASDVIADLTTVEVTISDESIEKVLESNPTISADFIESARDPAASILRFGEIGLHAFRTALAILESEQDAQKGGAT
jgi:hypothetical protein